MSDACARAGVDLDRVIQLLQAAERESQPADTGDWNVRRLEDLTAYIVKTHHGFVRDVTPRIESLLTKVVSRHGPTHPELSRIQELFFAISQELATHMMKEEQILFPYIDRLEKSLSGGTARPAACFPSVRYPVANMIAEHDDAGALLAEIRNLSKNYEPPAGACPTFQALYRELETFERDLHHHVHLENNILFPRAIALEEAAGNPN